MSPLEIFTEPCVGGIRVALRGELDFANAYAFDRRLREIESQEPGLMLLDLHSLDFMDSAGIGRLLAAHRRAAKAGRRLMLTRGSRTIQRVVALAALDQVLEFAPGSEREPAIA